MVTAQEIRSASQSISRQQKDLSRTTRQLEAQRKRLTSAIGVRTISRITRQLEQRRLGGIGQQITRSSQQLAQSQRQLSNISIQLKSQQQAQNRINRINSILQRVGRGKNVGSDFSRLSKSDQGLITKLISESKGRFERTTIRGVESQIQQTLTPEARAELIGKGFVRIPGLATQSFPITKVTIPGAQVSAITIPPKLRGLDRQIVNVKKQLFQLERKPIPQRTLTEKSRITGLQAKLDALSITRAATTPIKTATGIVTGVTRLGKEIVEFGIKGGEPPLAGVGEELRRRPEASVLGLAAIVIPIPIGKLTDLIKLNRLKGSKLSFVIEKPPAGFKRTPFRETFPRELKFKIDNKKVVTFLQNEIRKLGGNFDQLTKIDQEFLIGQVKARIRTRPDLFISKLNQETLKRAKIKDLTEFTRRRLEGDFPQLILKEKLRSGDLTDLQRRTLSRVAENLERKRIGGAIEIGPTPIKPFDLISPSEKSLIIRQLEAQVRARKLDISPASRKLLENVKTKSELVRIRKAILEGRKPVKASDFLSNFEKANIITQIRAQVLANPKLRLSQAQRIALRRVETKSQLERVRRAIEKGSDDILPKDLISKTERARIETQLGVQARAREFKAFGKKQIQIQVVKPVFKVKTTQPTLAQQALLKRLRESKTIQAKLVQEIRRQRIIAIPKPEALKSLQRTIQQQKVIQKQLQLEGQNLRKVQSSRQSFVRVQQAELERLQARQKSLIKARVGFVSVERTQLLSQIQLQRQSVKEAERVAQRGAQQFESFFQAFAQVQNIAQPQRFSQRVAQKAGLKLKKPIVPAPLFLKTKLLTTSKKILKERTQAYNAFARAQGSKKLTKLNTKPLSKSKAKDTMAWFIDNSLSATGAIRKAKGKIQKSRLGIPSNYFSNTRRKYREYKIRKGQPIFTPNKFIEFRSRRLDTIREKRNIKLAALVARKRKAITKRIPPPKFKSTFGKKKKK